MGLNTKKFALALGLTGGIAYIICAFIVSLFPGLTLKLIISLFHLVDGEVLTRNVTVTFGGAVAGALEVFVYGCVFGFVFALIYNRLVAPRPASQV